MKHATAKVSAWQRIGGVLEIPDGWFVHKVDLDVEKPYLQITKDDISMTDEKTLFIPKSLAYYLSTHFCGSKVMHETIEEGTRRDIKNAIMSVLGL